MIPNMVNIVKGYADHEKEIFGELTEARKTFAAASSSGDVSGVMAAESMLSQAILNPHEAKVIPLVNLY